MKYYVLQDLNDPTKLKIESRSSARGSICEVDKSLIGKAIKVIDSELDEMGVTRKIAVLDIEAEQARVDAIFQKEAEKQAEKAAYKALIDAYKALNPEDITSLAEAKVYLKELNKFLKAALKQALDV